VTTTYDFSTVRRKLRLELVRKGWTQLDLANRLGHPVSTLGSWLRGVAPAPTDLLARIERALKLPAGALSDVDISDMTRNKE
jgi:transcriptional regulator with XRE-family HTH domain